MHPGGCSTRRPLAFHLEGTPCAYSGTALWGAPQRWGHPWHTAVGRQPAMEGASAGRAAVLGGRGLTRRLLPAVVAAQPAGAVLVLVLGGAVQSRAECWLGSLAGSAQS